MRADIKLGVVVGIVVVSSAVGYYALRANREKPIQVVPFTNRLADRTPSKAADPTAGNRAAKPLTTADRGASHPAAAPRNAGSSRSGIPNAQPAASRDGGTAPVSAPALTPGLPSAPPAAERLADASPAMQPSTTPQTGSESPLATSAGENAAGRPVEPAPIPAVTTKALADASKPVSEQAVSNSLNTRPEARAPLSLAVRVPTPVDSSQRNVMDADAAVDTHRVQTGDTMSSLAERYYGSAALAGFLVAGNPQLADPNHLQPGQTVRIPPQPKNGPSTSSASAPRVSTKASRTYTVKAGDSFYKIAGDQLGSAARWKELYELNKELVKGDPTRLRVGQVLTLPNP